MKIVAVQSKNIDIFYSEETGVKKLMDKFKNSGIIAK